ncbi:MAG: YdcF family protein, partial [Opitutae bacterium]|nr:YdcF family protein [Opitutae bacterium]
MLFLNKLLPVFVLPLGIVVLLLLVALWRKKRWPVVAALVVLYLGSIPFTGDRLIGWLESGYPAVPVAEAGPADAIVVLGGIFGPPVAPGFLPNLAESAERLEAGIVLMQAGKAPWLVFTGGRIPWEGRDRVEGEDSKAQAMLRGVPAEKIIITREVGNTADEARAVAGLMKERGWRRIILVTTG